MRKIVYGRADGGISIVSVPVDTDEAISKAQAKLPADAINPTVVDDSLIPTDRSFRNAWKPDLTIDMIKARQIQEQKIEQKRREKVRDLLEREALGENVAVEKANIRAINAKALVDAAQTPDELKASIPDILR